MKTSRTKTAALLLLALTAAHAARAQEPAPPVVIIQPPPAAQQPAPAATQDAPAAQQPSAPRTTQQTAAPAARGAAGERPAGVPPPPITGRVVGEGGEPVPGVTVFAAPRAFGTGPRPPVSTASDDGGNFQFGGLAPGLYRLYASMPAYVTEPDPVTGQPGGIFRPGDTALLRMTKGGIITGTVTDPQGEPLVGLSVRAIRVRDLDGRVPQTPFPASVEDRTDDRGVYRAYGLPPGVYVVLAGSSPTPSVFSPVSAFGGDAPTFYPSSTRDTASEVTVRAGQELAGIDIRYREEQGRRVTGTLDLGASAAPEFGVGVMLTYASTGIIAGSASVNTNSPDRSFSIEGVADGEYDLQASSGGREGSLAASAPLRVSVKGADVTGLRVTLVPLAAASGTLVVEPAAEAERARAECKAVRPSARRPQETIVTATPERPAAAGRPFSRFAMLHEAPPDESGAFTLRALEAGRYRLSVRLFDEALYVRSIQQPGAAALAAPAASPRASAAAATRTTATAAARETFDVKPGQQFGGLVVRLSEGAASFAGRVALAEGAAPQTPAPTRVHLVPQERERADDSLRYYEAAAGADGAFAFRNVAPGRYLVLARAEAEAGDAPPRAAAWDSGSRAILRREAEAANTTAELLPCQRTADFVLRFPQTK